MKQQLYREVNNGVGTKLIEVSEEEVNSPRYNVQSAVRDTLIREEGQTGVQSHIEYGTDERSE